MNETTGIDTFIEGERYISLDVFMGKYASTGDLYQGYVIGYGYVNIVQRVGHPLHLNGRNPRPELVPYTERHFELVSEMVPDRSPEMVHKSLKGLFTNGEAVITVKAGMTLSGIASVFNVTVDDLVRWNHIEDPDKIVVGQKIKITDANRIPMGNAPAKPNINMNSGEEDNFLFSPEMGYIALGISALSAGMSMYSEIPMYNRMASTIDPNYFLARRNGGIAVWKNNYYGGRGVSPDFVKAQKLAFLNQINKLRWVKYGGYVTNTLGVGISISQMYYANNVGQRFEASVDTFMGIIGFTGVGWPAAAAYSLSSPLRKTWQEKVLPVQMETGIEGCASVMPFK